MTDCVIVSTAVATVADADRLADAVVAERLAACVQALPMRSTYRWKGRVEHASEVLLLMKTRAVLADALIVFVKKMHAYEVPEVIVSSIEGGSPDYLEWLRGETARDGEDQKVVS